MAPARFRSRKDHRQAARFTANARFKVLPNGKLRLPKIGDVPVRWSRPLPSEPSSVTVIKDSAGPGVLAAVEARTDERAWTGGLSLLGEQDAEEVLALCGRRCVR